MRIIDARNQPPPKIDAIHRHYPPNHYTQIGIDYRHRPTTDKDIKEFQQRAEGEGAVAIFISNYGQSAYIPIRAGSQTVPQTEHAEPPVEKGKEYWHKVTDTQKGILLVMEASRIVEVHSDGDVTFQAKGRMYVLTTEGEVFTKVLHYGGNGPDAIPQVQVEDNLLQYYDVPPSAQ